MRPKINIDANAHSDQYKPVSVGSWLFLQYGNSADMMLHVVAQTSSGHCNLISITTGDANRKTSEHEYSAYEDIGEKCFRALIGDAKWRFADVTINAKPV